MRWARRFASGLVRLGGELPALPLVDGVDARGGPAELAFRFVGGEQPAIVELALVTPVSVEGRLGDALDLTLQAASLDGAPFEGAPRMDRLAQAVVRALSDVRAFAEVRPAGQLLVRFQHGVEAQLHDRAVVTLAGAATGPPQALTLCEPVSMSVDGDGLRLSHRRLRRLSSLAALRLEGASLHPDGEVRLRGKATVGVDRAFRGGLERAGARLSDLVRRSPRFASVRGFLKR